MTLHDTPTSLGATSRRRFLRSLGLLVAGTSLIAACGPSTTTTPAAQPTSAPATSAPAAAQPTAASSAAQPTAAGAAAKPTSAPAAAPAQATPGGIGTQPISIEWWRRNYTPGSQNA